MGWIAYHKDGTILQEGSGHGRPVQAGDEGQLRFIVQEDYGNRVGVDLTNGVIVIGFDQIEIQNDTLAIHNPRTILHVADETSVISELTKVRKTRPDKDGNFDYKHEPFKWRPIWFSRVFGYASETPVKVIGLQTTLGTPYKRKNIKKLVSLLPDGRIAID